jgi:hypothetical protein
LHLHKSKRHAILGARTQNIFQVLEIMSFNKFDPSKAKSRWGSTTVQAAKNDTIAR